MVNFGVAVEKKGIWSIEKQMKKKERAMNGMQDLSDSRFEVYDEFLSMKINNQM